MEKELAKQFTTQKIRTLTGGKKMLSLEQINIINEQLQQDNAYEFIKTMITHYAKDVEHISQLLSFIPELADKQIKIRQEKIYEYVWATDLLLGERCRYPIHKRKSKNKKEYNPDFPTLLYVCKAHFPNGNCDGGSIADKEFFAEFIETIKNKNGFDYENKEDWRWIFNIANCSDWMISVINQHIDANFQINKLK